MVWKKETALPSSFDLFFDVKDYGQLIALYTQICDDKRLIEELCIAHEVKLPTTGESS